MHFEFVILFCVLNVVKGMVINMKQSIFEIISNKLIADNTYEMVLKGDTADITKPGQFVCNLKI